MKAKCGTVSDYSPFLVLKEVVCHQRTKEKPIFYHMFQIKAANNLHWFNLAMYYFIKIEVSIHFYVAFPNDVFNVAKYKIYNLNIFKARIEHNQNNNQQIDSNQSKQNNNKLNQNQGNWTQSKP